MVVSIAAVMIACGGGSSMPKNLTQAQAQAIASALSNGVAQSLTGAIGADSSSRANLVHRATAPLTAGLTCTPTTNGESCTLPISATFTCSGGGTMAISGTLSGTLDNSGDGSVQAQIAADPTNCAVDGLLLNGDPSVNVAAVVNVANDSPVFPITGMETGAVSYGPNPAGTCQLNVTYSISSSLSCTATGTACGRAVSGSC